MCVEFHTRFFSGGGKYVKYVSFFWSLGVYTLPQESYICRSCKFASGASQSQKAGIGMRYYREGNTAEYVSSAHGRGTLGCSGRGGWALNA